MRKLGIILILLLATPAAVLAEGERLYWGVMIGSTDYEVRGSRLYVTSLNGRVGWDFLSWLAVEGRFLTSDSSSSSSLNVNGFKIPYMGTAFAKFSLPANRTSRAKVYALAGYSVGRLEFEEAGTNVFFDASGPAYGVGVEIFADDKNGLNIEWARMVDDSDGGDDYTITQIGIGYVRRF